MFCCMLHSSPLRSVYSFSDLSVHLLSPCVLSLSGGASLGFYHMGVVKALRAQGLLPRVVSGASAGSIITGIVGVRTEAELDGLLGKPFPSRQQKTPCILPDEMKIDFLQVRTQQPTTWVLSYDTMPRTVLAVMR